jgi:hypothetical protein
MQCSRQFLSALSISVIAAAVATGCATMESMYSKCDQSNAKFSEVSICTKATLKADSRYNWHMGYVAYVNRAIAAMEVMEERVTAGTLSDKEARYNTQEILASMQREIKADANAISSSIAANKSIKTNCTAYGSNTSCTSR